MGKLKVVIDGEATIVSFLDVAFLDETSIRELGDELEALVTKSDKINLIINFTNIDYLSSAVLGRLVKVHKLIKAKNGKMHLCHIKNSILQVFKSTKLDKIFAIFPDQAKALAGLKGPSSGFKFFWKK